MMSQWERLPTAPYRLRGYCQGAWDTSWDAGEEHFGTAWDLSWDVEGRKHKQGKGQIKVVWRGTRMGK